jgi:hypothetical protein
MAENEPWWQKHLDPMSSNAPPIGLPADPEMALENTRLAADMPLAEPDIGEATAQAGETSSISEGPPAVSSKTSVRTPTGLPKVAKMSPGEAMEKSRYHHQVDMAQPADTPPEPTGQSPAALRAAYNSRNLPSAQAVTAMLQQVLNRILNPQTPLPTMMSPSDLDMLSRLWLTNGGH